MKWPTVPLEKLAVELQPGFAQQPDREGGGLPHLRTNNVSEDGTVDLSTIRTIVPSKEQREKYSLQPSDILFNNTNSPALVGKTALFQEQGEFLFSNHMTRIRVRRNIANPSYIARYLHWIWKTGGFRHMVTQWVSQAAINRDQLTKLHVPLPPPSEQKRIVEILDQADAIRKKRDEADAKAELILPALFYKMFGDPVSNSSRWEKTTLGELSLEFRYGTSTRCGVERIGLPVLRIPNVIGGEIDVSDLKYADLPDDEAGRLLLEPGDLLFVRTNGNPAYVGRCAIFDMAERYAFASYLIRTRIDHERADPWFVAEYLRTSEGRRAMAPYIRTTAGQSNISVEGLQQIPVLLPPLSLQRQFRGFIATMRASRRKEEQSRSKFRALFDSMLHRAFSGDLTAKWRKSHMKELLVEMEVQARALAARSNENDSPVVKANRHAGYDMYNKAALAAYIVHRCHEESQPFGRVKLAKLYYLAQSKAKIELTETFSKRAAGPLDDEIFKFLSLAQKNRWVILDAKQGRLKPVRPGPEAGKAAEQAAKVLGAAKPMVDEMLDQMKSWSYQTLERWATVLEAVQFIASAGQPTKAETVKDVIRKHPEWVPKLNRQEFSDANIEATLRGLCKFGFVANHN